MTSPAKLKLKVTIKRNLQLHRVVTSRTRLLPNFIMIGASRSGTTSLYKYLLKHPWVVPPLFKEVHFFDLDFDRGLDWYRRHFPSVFYERYAQLRGKPGIITGEASPYYMFHPLAPRRIAATIPDVKLIALLRNPVDRAYSHYHHSMIKRHETLSFEEAIDSEEDRLRGEEEKILANGDYRSASHRSHSYLSRGIYADQLPLWMDLFPRDQILILKSEDLYANPPLVVEQVLEFLKPLAWELPDWELEGYKQYNEVGYQPIDPALRERLINFFRPHNQRLYQYLGRDFGWDA